MIIRTHARLVFSISEKSYAGGIIVDFTLYVPIDISNNGKISEIYTT